MFQKRFNGKVDFSVKGWTDYVNGFGNLTGEFWLGLDYIYRLASTPVKLRVDLAAADGEKRFALFSGFKIADKAHKYTLTAGSYIGRCTNFKLTKRIWGSGLYSRISASTRSGGEPCTTVHRACAL